MTTEANSNFTSKPFVNNMGYGIKHKPTSVKTPQANAILEQVHHVITMMLHTAELDNDIDMFLINTT